MRLALALTTIIHVLNVTTIVALVFSYSEGESCNLNFRYEFSTWRRVYQSFNRPSALGSAEILIPSVSVETMVLWHLSCADGAILLGHMYFAWAHDTLQEINL